MLATGRAVPCPDDPEIGFLGPWYSFSDNDLVDIEGRCARCDTPVALSQAAGAPAGVENQGFARRQPWNSAFVAASRRPRRGDSRGCGAAG